MPAACCSWVAPTERVQNALCGTADERRGLLQNAASALQQLQPQASVWAAPRNSRPVLLIRMNHGSAGFFAYVLFAVNQLLFAERQGMDAFIDFGECTVNGRDHYASGAANLYYDRARGPNVWEYYFEQVGPPLEGREARALSSKAMWRLHHESRVSVYAYYYGRFANKRREGYDEPWFKSMRQRASKVLQRHVKLKPHVQEALDDFWHRNLASRQPVLGLHVRGTDKDPAIGGAIVPPSSYARHIGRYLDAYPNASLFVATDSPTSLAWFRERYGERVVARSALQNSSEEASIIATENFAIAKIGKVPTAARTAAGRKLLRWRVFIVLFVRIVWCACALVRHHSQR